MTTTTSVRSPELATATTHEANADHVDRGDDDYDATLRRLSNLAYLLDDRFRVPGTNIRFGLDGIVGLLPGIGDVTTAAVSGYIVLEARRLGIPKRLLMKMVSNIAIDAAVGIIPIVGDFADIHWKANRKNVHLLLEHAKGTRTEAMQFAAA